MAFRTNAFLLAFAVFVTGAFLVILSGISSQAQAAACHSAYTVYGHWVPQHTVKATALHSSYVIYRHYVPTHVVKANCR